ncbi:MAG: hypothetical protein Q9187_005986 [Circinaria calcarea]
MNLDENDVDIPMDPEHPKDALFSKPRHVRGLSLTRGRQSRVHVTLHIFVLYSIIAGLVVVGLTLLNMPDTCHDPSQGIYSPASDAVAYRNHVFRENFVSKGPYMGRPDGIPDEGVPSDQTDALWEDLYQCVLPNNFSIAYYNPTNQEPSVGVSQIPYDQARQLPNATERIPGTTEQYVIELDVFHQLHCLNAIRKTLYPERYWDTYDDYYIKDGSPPGRGQRNYTSTDAKHYGNQDTRFLPI